MCEKSITSTGFTALDIETTGLSAKNCGIVEIAALRRFPDGTFESFQTLVDPKMPIPGNVIPIHGITDEMVMGKPCAEEAAAGLLDFVEDSPLVIHNARFDLGFLTPVIMSAGLEWRSPAVFDTVKLSRKSFPGLRSYSLENLSRYLGFESERHHRALADCRYCACLFLRVIEVLGTAEMSLEEFSRRHGESQFLLGR